MDSREVRALPGDQHSDDLELVRPNARKGGVQDVCLARLSRHPERTVRGEVERNTTSP